ncbi:type VII secretion protein EccB [Streptosporangium sp. KLBMP 9127]|nr:type VII secretion protein EccB [Streptosporangium sp. KLBMP 9127]
MSAATGVGVQSRRDLYQAYRLTIQRVGLALMQSEPDRSEWPLRRQNIGFLAGIAVAVLIGVGFAVWGLLRPAGGKSLENPATLIVERETGARYVFSQQERRLIPVANYASARLILDSAVITEQVVAREALQKYERGHAVGIAGAPDSLPASGLLVRGPWPVCVRQGEDEAGGRKPYVTLMAGTDVGGRPVGDDSALIVDVGGQAWVIWRDTRMRVTSPGVRSLTPDEPGAVPVDWLNALPEGSDFAAPAIPGRGRPATGPGGDAAAVGQLFRVAPVAGSGPRWYVLLADGLAPISHTQAVLLANAPESKAAYGGGAVVEIDLDAATANAAPQSRARLPGGDLPKSMPKMMAYDAASPLCAVYSSAAKGSARARLVVGAKVPEPRKDASDLLRLPPGRAILAGLLPGDGQLAAVQTYYLVTDQGRRFAIPDKDLLPKLGYSVKQATPVPANVLQLIPQGPALDPAKARLPVVPPS